MKFRPKWKINWAVNRITGYLTGKERQLTAQSAQYIVPTDNEIRFFNDYPGRSLFNLSGFRFDSKYSSFR